MQESTVGMSEWIPETTLCGGGIICHIAIYRCGEAKEVDALCHSLCKGALGNRNNQSSQLCIPIVYVHDPQQYEM